MCIKRAHVIISGSLSDLQKVVSWRHEVQVNNHTYF